jgi:mono/diheme cytochrome c family protein|tara:strand:+ start:1815 stop:2198 length:384 start_codon:yes stop_codon:yes gene_type:complete
MKQIFPGVGALVLFLAVVPGAYAQGLPSGVTDAMVTEGQQIYVGAGLCATCHGPVGEGFIGPSLIDAEWLNGSGTYEEIVGAITNGVALADVKNAMGVMMPPRGGSSITDDQVNALASYVWKLSNGG